MTTVSVGAALGKYQILGEIGHGGMSIVYRALDTQLQRHVAIKVMHSFLAAQSEARERFHREAVAVARLKHPHIVEIFDYSGADAPISYIVMELVEGVPLAQFLEQGAIVPPEAALVLARAIADALWHAHSHGVIHRDLKPDNIMISQTGDLKLTDFGIARIRDNQTLTVTGTLLGSPAYMAPEYIDGNIPDERADQFSFGAMLYQFAVGTLPFVGASPHALLKRIANGEYAAPDVANPQIHAVICRIIKRCLALNARDRYENVSCLLSEIDTFFAELGIDAAGALRGLLTEPHVYAARLLPILTEKYVMLGKRALSHHATGQAIEHFDRVLNLDSEHKEVRRIMLRLSRRALGRTVARAVGISAAILIAAVFLGRVASSYFATPATAPRHNAPLAELTPTPPSPPATPDVVPTAPLKAPRREMPENHPSPVASPKPTADTAPIAVRTVDFKPAGQWVTVYVDGHSDPVLREQMREFSLSLSHGNHRLRFTNDKAQPLEMELHVAANEPVGTTLIRLRPIDARLRMSGGPDAMLVEIAGRRFVVNQRTREDPIFVPLPEGEGSIEYEVVARQIDNNQEIARRTLMFRPGQEQVLAIDAAPLYQ